MNCANLFFISIGDIYVRLIIEYLLIFHRYRCTKIIIHMDFVIFKWVFFKLYSAFAW